ncbi:amino acid transporter [Bacillaceae bacterium Marseille-Q3522]|nr:amino acid transporter [Bacillaceae bacterium Marseille-Q3522]
MIEAMIHGFILAFGLILPLGVQNIFIFQQGALQPNMTKAFPAIIAASLCDTFLISISVLGITVVVLGSLWIRIGLLLAGIVFLLYMGFSTWNSKHTDATDEERIAYSVKKQVTFAISVSLLNPHAIIDTAGVIGTSSLTYSGTEKAGFTIACICVSWLWFTGLAYAGKMTGKLDKSGDLLLLFNKLSALVMWGTAVYLGISLL